MIEPIVIKVVDKVPIVVSGPDYVVCDNSDYTVVWQLDEEWAQFEHRTMQVNYKDGTYERVLFTGDSCTLPAIPVKDWFFVGLFAGDIHTTRPARLLAVRSATTDSGEERDPTPDGYTQAIQALDGKLDKNQGAENAGKALVVGDDGTVVPGEAQGSSLPAMSSDTAGKMLTNDGEKAEWGGAVRYDVSQNLTAEQKRQGRSNIDAVTVVRNVAAESQLPDIMWGIDNNSAISLSGLSNFAGLHNALTKAGLSIQSSTTVFLQYITTNLPVSNIITHIFQLFTTENEQALVSVGQAIRGSHPLSNWQATKTADLSNYVGVAAQTFSDAEKAQARQNIGLTPAAKTDDMTQSVGLDAETGELWTKPDAGSYTLPVASPTQLGGVKPVAKTDAMTRGVGVDTDGGLYTEPDSVFYIDLAGDYPNYTCPVAMADIKAAYEAGKVLECLCAIEAYTVTLPLFMPMPSANAWLFSGSGALIAMGFPAQSLTVAIVDGTVQASNTLLAQKYDIPDALPNPYALVINMGDDQTYYDGNTGETVNIPTTLPNPNTLTIKVGDTTTTYDGSAAVTIDIPNGDEVAYG